MPEFIESEKDNSTNAEFFISCNDEWFSIISKIAEEQRATKKAFSTVSDDDTPLIYKARNLWPI